MFTVTDPRNSHTCGGFTRREFLRIGGLGIGGLTLPGLLEAKARAAAEGIPVSGKSVVLLFLQGGPPHIETFDPKMTAPSEYRSITGEVRTRLAGVTFGGTFPKLAAMARKLAVVRSYGSQHSNHTYGAVAGGGNPMKAAMGSIYSRVAGLNHPETRMPTNILVLPEAVRPGLKLASNFETEAMPTLTDPGNLGSTHRAFNPVGGGPLKQDMELKIPPERLADRRGLLRRLDRIRRKADASGLLESSDTYRQQAFDILARGISDAFDLSKEDPRTVERYDTSRVFDPKPLNRWKDLRRVSNQLGLQMLLARRLCEAGCGFVTVSDCGWDYHADNDSPKRMAALWPMSAQVDHAVSAFIEDTAARGLTDDILLVITGEMGRTPKLNKKGGRDHYGKLTPLVFSGGGLSMGQVIGASDGRAAEPATRGYTPANLLGTVMRVLFDVGRLRVWPGLPGDLVEAVDAAEPIRELF